MSEIPGDDGQSIEDKTISNMLEAQRQLSLIMHHMNDRIMVLEKAVGTWIGKSIATDGMVDQDVRPPREFPHLSVKRIQRVAIGHNAIAYRYNLNNGNSAKVLVVDDEIVYSQCFVTDEYGQSMSELDMEECEFLFRLAATQYRPDRPMGNGHDPNFDNLSHFPDKI